MSILDNIFGVQKKQNQEIEVEIYKYYVCVWLRNLSTMEGVIVESKIPSTSSNFYIDLRYRVAERLVLDEYENVADPATEITIVNIIAL